MTNLYRAYRDVKENLNCYRVGHCAADSLATAKALIRAERLGLSVSFEHDIDWSMAVGEPEELYHKKMESGEWQCVSGSVEYRGEIVAALGGIFYEYDRDLTGYIHELLTEAVDYIDSTADLTPCPTCGK